jgi:hypothetical protein
MYLNAKQSRQSTDIVFVTGNTNVVCDHNKCKTVNSLFNNIKCFSCFLKVSDFGFNVGFFSLSETKKAISYITEDIISGNVIILIMI